jgi:hypothetical protein
MKTYSLREELARVRAERDQSVARLTRLHQGCPGPERWPDELLSESARVVVGWFGTEVEVPSVVAAALAEHDKQANESRKG